jgi:hypothetical protein
VPEANAVSGAGRLIERLPELWARAGLGERRKLLLTMLEAVYVDAREERRIVAIKPKAPFKPIFQVATMPSWIRPLSDRHGAIADAAPAVDTVEADSYDCRAGGLPQRGPGSAEADETSEGPWIPTTTGCCGCTGR